MYAKKNKSMKALVVALSVVLIMALTVAGTLAFLKVNTESVVNTFSPSNIDLTLGETTGNDYQMVPGVDIPKDPKVTVTADIDCYVFVEVEESGDFEDFMTYGIATGWNELTGFAGVYYREVSADDAKDSEEFAVLADNKVTVLSEVTKEMMDDLNKDDATLPELTFTAYAIQKAGFESNPAGAWAEAKGQQTQG